MTDETESCEVCGGPLEDGDGWGPGAIMPTATAPSVLVCSQRCAEVGTLETWRQLRRLELVARQARAALLDEREGDFTRDVLEVHTHSAALLHLVATW